MTFLATPRPITATLSEKPLSERTQTRAGLLRAALLSTSIFTTLPSAAAAQDVAAPTLPSPTPSIQIMPAPVPASELPTTAITDAAAVPTDGPSTNEAETPSAAESTTSLAVSPAFGATPPAAASPFGSLADIQACPYKQIRAAYDEAVTGKDVLDTLAVEREILILCDERNTLVAKLLEGESSLADLLTPDTAPTVAVTGSVAPNTSTAAAQLDRLNTSPDQPAATATPDPAAEGSTSPEPVQPAPVEAALAQPPAPGQCEPLYATRYVSPGSAETGATAQAGITDTASGTNLTIKVGDMLTGGYVVESITKSGVTLMRNNLSLPLPGFAAETEAEGFYVQAATSDPTTEAEQGQ